MQVFTGHAETTPLALILKYNLPVNMPLDFIKAQKFMEVVKLLFCCPDQCSLTNSYVDDNSCLICE
jgi:hypothetical protein